MKVILSIGLDEFTKQTWYSDLERTNNAEHESILFDHREHLGQIISNAWTLDEFYRNSDRKLFETYEKLKKLIKDNKADVLIVGTDNIYHPEFVKDLDVYTVLESGDDPNASYMRTVPYIWAFDHVVCFAVRYHENMPAKMTDKLIEWGAKRAAWRPYGVRESYYNPSLTEEDIFNKKRSIDLLFVGGAYREKMELLLKLKKVFGRKFKLYGRWGWKTWGYSLLLHRQWVRVRPLPQELFVPTYQDAKIGINMHQSGELGNGRLYQLPMNGIMQICDCGDVLDAVFEPGKEIVGYSTADEAIELIKYYLDHDDERKEIAAAGFRKAMNNYTFPHCYHNMLEEIKKGMLEQGIKYYKDGTKIELRSPLYESVS